MDTHTTPLSHAMPAAISPANRAKWTGMTNHTPATTETLSPTRRQCTVQHSCPHAPAEANPAQTPAVVLLHARSAATGPATHRVRLSSLARIADTPPPRPPER